MLVHVDVASHITSVATWLRSSEKTAKSLVETGDGEKVRAALEVYGWRLPRR
jgi:hypothetical protein